MVPSISTTFGLIMALKFFVPNFLVDSAWLTFGKIDPPASQRLTLRLPLRQA